MHANWNQLQYILNLLAHSSVGSEGWLQVFYQPLIETTKTNDEGSVCVASGGGMGSSAQP